jgi:nucleoside-diphosphate-sugar epimerase
MADERPSTLVIGGAGNLGRRIIACLLERGASCVGSFDLVAYAGDGADRVVSACGDITDADALARAMVGVKTVYHTASIIDIRPVPSLRMHHVNVTGTECVIEACKAAGVGALLYTSSLEVVSGCNEKGVTRKLDGVDESVPVPAKHHLPYANTKAYAERLVLAADSTDLRTCSIRPGYIMGAECIGLKMEMLHAAARHDHYVTAKIPGKSAALDPAAARCGPCFWATRDALACASSLAPS